MSKVRNNCKVGNFNFVKKLGNCPYNELNTDKHCYKHVDYEQTIMVAVESVTDMIDLVIEILQKLYEKGRK